MMTYKFGDVVLVPFPFSNLNQEKKRPAVVVSSDAYQKHRQDCVLLAITSQMRGTLGFAEAYVNAWQDVGLLKPSVFKPLIFFVRTSSYFAKIRHIDARRPTSLASRFATNHRAKITMKNQIKTGYKQKEKTPCQK